ncbi:MULTISPECIES: YdcF family protein [Gordonibacter]|uniref:YdcF family protein n=1 Tax=Gordonibacter faecis TaxID=3047475 RepID=A0ABT7DKC9_9ACTN|nr:MULTISPECIES: YdcF family protein [unclassified Gordonibacter]MDJ1649986.1 YdcF family protein [Gordonibacter sp. KGMB12511]HIW76693.1 YdcF family protein [Candidatus Gordonibacter avicola]
MILELILIYFPALVFGWLFWRNYRKEPRQFRNALYFLALCLFAFWGLSVQFNLPWLVLLGFAAIPFGLVALVVFLIANTVVVVRREGLSLAHLLPGLVATAIIAACIGLPLLMVAAPIMPVMALTSLVFVEGSYIAFTFTALLLYSWLYRRLPKRCDYDYIVVHGAGLSGTKPTPLLAGRLDKGVELWEAGGKRALIIASGGQGPDEQLPESTAMKNYLVEERGIPADAIIEENRSATTMENLRNSKAIMDARSGAGAYRAAVVTSDYHVFRTAEYAHQIGLVADGVGSTTARYFWPTAFIREFVAVTKAHLWPILLIFVLWLLPAGCSLLAR